MIGATFCSGIGAPEMAAPWVDWRLASEIEPFPREVLQYRYGYKTPEDHNQGDPLLWGDMTEVTPELMRERGVPLPNLIVAGTPCQSFSVAGLRKGTADARGNLTLKFVEICHAIAAARPNGKLAALWENVPGVLSDKGNAFGCFVGGLVGADDAIPSPDGGSWPSAGMVSGPRARVAWRVLNAEHFGVAQRRERVFVVIDFGGALDPAAVLFQPRGLHEDHQPRRETGEKTTPANRAKTDGGGGAGFDCDGGLIVGLDEAPVAFDTTQITSKANGSNPKPGDPCHPLASGAHAPAIATPWAVRRLSPRECERLQGFPDNHTLIPRAHKRTLSAEALADEMRYLRDTWPDLTEDEARHLAADGPRYKAQGNSMAVPCVKWIIDRMKTSMEATAND